MHLANLAGRASIVVDDRVLDVHRASDGELGPDPMVLCDLAVHARLRELAASAADGWSALDQSLLLPPVPRPGKVVGLALNYRSHAEETGREIPTEPGVFAKFPSCLTGPYQPIVLPRGLDRVDYEAELVVAIGRAGKAIPAERAWEHVAGLMVGQDVSDRAEQFRPPVRQFTLAKSYDSFGPVGPVLVTPDELPDPDDVEISCHIDGERLQQGSTADLIFPVSYLVGWLSRYATLEVGDLVFTGTPAGVGNSRHPPVYLRPGMVVETAAAGIGRLRNECVAG
jgi:2-keto-4-pentenoate hydratase/2-oxohepta-3-ene-1,7-dioic acid hydratase in catechol pathway